MGLAVALELGGWRVIDRDRALLVRMGALAGSLGLVTAAGAIAIHRGSALDEPRVSRRRPQRLTARTVFWTALAFGLLCLGVFYHVWIAT